MSGCRKVTSKADHGHDVTGDPLRCGTPLYYGLNKVERTEIVLCHDCCEAVRALEEATKPNA